MLTSILQFYYYPKDNTQTRDCEILKNCSNKHFFSIEALKASQDISNFYQQRCFYLLTMSKIQYRRQSLFFVNMLLLSNDISTNPGPNQNQVAHLSNNIWSPFRKRGLHMIQLNINSLLPKLDEIRNIAKHAKPAIFGITESKLDNTISDFEINIDEYVIIRSDRNRHGRGVACYIRKDQCFKTHNVLSGNIEGLVSDLLLPKTKPITVGILYRPPNQNNFIELLITDLENFSVLNREVILLSDFNINLLMGNIYLII